MQPNYNLNDEERQRASDANVPVDMYMQALGTNTLAGATFQRSISGQLSRIDQQKQMAGQTYSQMYEDLRSSSAVRGGLSDVRGFSGGMQQQYDEKMSAAMAGAMGQIGMGRQAAVMGLEMQKGQVGQQAFQEALQAQQGAEALDPRYRQLEVLAQKGKVTGDFTDYFNLANEMFGTNTQVSGAPSDIVDPTDPNNTSGNIPGSVTNFSEGISDLTDTETGEPLSMTARTTSVGNELTRLGLNDVVIKQSPFQDSQVSTVAQASQLILQLGQERALNDPNYNYAYETNLILRAVRDRTTLTQEEWNLLEPFTNQSRIVSQYGGTFHPPIRLGGKINEEGISGPYGNFAAEQVVIPVSKSNDAFIDYLLQEGIINTTSYRRSNITLIKDTTGFMKGYREQYALDFSKTMPKLSNQQVYDLYVNFLTTTNQQYAPGQ